MPSPPTSEKAQQVISKEIVPLRYSSGQTTRQSKQDPGCEQEALRGVYFYSEEKTSSTMVFIALPARHRRQSFLKAF